MLRKKLFIYIFSVMLTSSLLITCAEGIRTPNPTITLSADSGPSDTSLVVTGTYWTVGQAVNIYWSTQVDSQNPSDLIATIIPTTGGSFRVALPVMTGASVGVHWASAVQGTKQARASFNVTATSPLDNRLSGALDNLQAAISNISSNMDSAINSTKPITATIHVELVMEYADYMKTVVLLPLKAGTAYSGRLTLTIRQETVTYPEQAVFTTVFDQSHKIGAVGYYPSIGLDVDYFNEEFLCNSLTLFVADNSALYEPMTVIVDGLLEYKEVTNVGMLPVTVSP